MLEEKRSGLAVFSLLVLLRHNSVVGYADSEEPPKSMKLHASIQMGTMGFEKKKKYFY